MCLQNSNITKPQILKTQFFYQSNAKLENYQPITNQDFFIMIKQKMAYPKVPEAM
jgi:hypothetical protein